MDRKGLTFETGQRKETFDVFCDHCAHKRAERR
jgi:hypothetical protein